MTANDPIPLAKPLVAEEELRVVGEVIASGRLSMGPWTERFESEFAKHLGVAHASAVSSGTAGLHLSIRASGVTPGSEVITSPFSFVASANVMLYEQAKPVFVDVDPVSLTIDRDGARSAMTSRTSALLPVHIFGMPALIDDLTQLGLPIVEDACEALGATHTDGTPVGGKGNPAVFGFYANKQLTTGEGGLVAMDSLKVKELIDSERNQGRAPDMGWLDHDRLGFNYRLSEIQAAIGVAQLGRLEWMLKERERAAAHYSELLSGLEGVQLPMPEWKGGKRGWFVYVVQLPLEIDRDSVIRELRETGVDSKPYLPALHLMPHLAEASGAKPGEFPVAERAAKTGIALPFFPEITPEQLERTATALARAIGQPLRV